MTNAWKVRAGRPISLATLSVVRFSAPAANQAPIVDTGTLAGDLTALLLQVRRVLRHRLVRRILPDLHAEMQRNPALANPVRGRLQTERRARAATVLDRAIARGDVPATVDTALFNDAAGGLLYWRIIITRERADRGYVDALVNFIIAGLRLARP